MAEYFIHSKCCRENWALHYQDGKYELECLSCGRPAGPSLKIEGPVIGDEECAVCREAKTSCKNSH
jgi:hypothetical protein